MRKIHMLFVTTDTPAEGVIRIGLNRPEKRNAINPELRHALIDALTAARDDAGVHAIVIAGNDGHFCAGGDIDSMAGVTVQSARARMKSNHQMVRLIADSEKPVITAVEGFAVGAGAGIALLADTVVMGEGATFGIPFFRIGLVPDYALLYSLPRRVGVAKARQIMLYARMLKGADAFNAGLADEMVGDGQADARAVELAGELAAMPPMAFAIAKRQLGLFPTNLDTALEMEAMAQAVCMTSTEFDEGSGAFKEKRKPNFRG
jgi:2-(1,2-epoxy-1,2-dihydrophenyl)acetyl-CoA isomerase